MKLFLTLLLLAAHVYSGHAAIRGAIAEESKLLAAMKRVLRESSPYSGHAAVRGADDTASGADAAEKRIIEDLRVANYCGMFNAPCVTGAVCAQDPNANRLTCLCDASEGWTNGVAMDHRDIENIKKYNLFGFLSCSDVNECLDPTKNDCASADQCEDRSPGPLSSDQYACFCKPGFAPSAEGLRGPTQCQNDNEVTNSAPFSFSPVTVSPVTLDPRASTLAPVTLIPVTSSAPVIQSLLRLHSYYSGSSHHLESSHPESSHYSDPSPSSGSSP